MSDARGPGSRRPTRLLLASVVGLALAAALLVVGSPTRSWRFAVAPAWLGLLAWTVVAVRRRWREGGTSARRACVPGLAAIVALAALPWLLSARQDAHEEECVRLAESRARRALETTIPEGLPPGLGRFVEWRGSGHLLLASPWDVGNVNRDVVALRTAVFEHGSCSAVLVVSKATEEAASLRVTVERREAQIHGVRLHEDLSAPLLVVTARMSEFLGRHRWW